jgi:tRNA/tmRNA/rRNA uracil-C5-methylase (TrmA/RlmC/RlmD family)
MKYLSHFEIENDKKEIINIKENQLIDKYIIDINNKVKNKLNNYIKEIEKLDIKKVKEEILISSKVLKREMMILKYIYKKIKKKRLYDKITKINITF